MSFYFIFVSFFTFLTIFVSIVQKSYFSFINPQKIIENDTLLSDFNPNLDLTVISIIESKNKNTDEPFDFSIIKSSQTSNKVTLTPTPQITENSTSKEAVIKTETVLTPTSITPTPQITENSTSKETATSVATSIKGGSTSTTE